MKHFTDLKAWTTGLLLTSKIYECTRTFPKEEIYGLTSQMRRASTSILANLAEGFGRFIWDDRAHRFTISRGECAELEALVHIAFTLTFLDERWKNELVEQTRKEGALLSGLISFCRRHSKNS